jgi:uncharacterized membrane protein YsdA (DUF1294 family)
VIRHALFLVLVVLGLAVFLVWWDERKASTPELRQFERHLHAVRSTC